MLFLIDHNIEGQAMLLFSSIQAGGWLELLSIRFVMFSEVQLAIDSSDRIVWKFAQENNMILLTANRSMKGEDSLEQVIREDIQPNSLPVVTLGNLDRIGDRVYRDRCSDRLIEILLDLDNLRGVSRIFIP
ncbi:MAG: ACP S-malonyltransferase [Spirulina sp.]